MKPRPSGSQVMKVSERAASSRGLSPTPSKKTFAAALGTFLLLGFLPFAQQRNLGVQPARQAEPGYANSWAVLIGINDYQTVQDLNYAIADARAVRDFLINHAGFGPDKVFLLENQQATKRAIQRLLGDQLRRETGNRDRVLVFFAGHGETLHLPGGGQMGFLVPYEGDRHDLYATCISMDEIRSFSELLSAKHMLFVVDACYGGIAGRQRRTLTPEAKGYWEKLTAEPGRQIITAGRANEVVVESDQWGHSLFTRFLLKGLGGSADLDGNQLISTTELHQYLQPKVSVESANRQTPQLRYLAGDGEFVFLNF